jgi:hypothetical protein
MFELLTESELKSSFLTSLFLMCEDLTASLSLKSADIIVLSCMSLDVINVDVYVDTTEPANAPTATMPIIRISSFDVICFFPKK